MKKIIIMLLIGMTLFSFTSVAAQSQEEDKIFRVTFQNQPHADMDLQSLEIMNETLPNRMGDLGEDYVIKILASDNSTLYSRGFSFRYEIAGHFGEGGSLKSGVLSQRTVVLPYFESARYLVVENSQGEVVVREIIGHPGDQDSSDEEDQVSDRSNATRVSSNPEESGFLNNALIPILLVVMSLLLITLLYYIHRKQAPNTQKTRLQA